MSHPKRGATRRGLWPSAISENFYERASDDPADLQLWAYTDKWSYRPGAVLQLHVSTNLREYRVEIWRDGAVRQSMSVLGPYAGTLHPTPDDCSVRGCGWPAALSLDLPLDWPSGAYGVTLSGMSPDGTLMTAHHLFILRAAPGDGARLLQVAATGSWLAYNDWGGCNHYEGILGPNRDQFSPRVSIHRPFSRGFVVLPEGVPRAVLREPPPMGAALSHPHVEWAYANGYSKKYASAGWASYDRHFFRWAEANGYEIDLCSQQDIHADPALLDGYDTVAMVGHDEYWSKEMRDAIDRFVDRGGRVARFAGNFLWQTRVEDGGDTQICYKYRARAEDPLYRDPATRSLTTTAWESLEVARPGASTFGVNALRGMYAGWAGAAPRHAGGFTVYRSDHWSLEGTDLYYGDILSVQSRIFGYEVDGLEYTFRDGLPEPLGTDGAPEGVEIVAMGVAVLAEENHGDRGTVHFLGDDDLRFAAEAIHGEATPETMAKRRYGAGMVVNFKRGAGEVFTAGTCDWVVGLKEHDPYVDRITRNVLDRFLANSDGL